MKTLPVSEFKAKCIALLKEGQRTREPLLITLRGRAIARVEPLLDDLPLRRLGALKGKMVIKGDIVRTDFDEDWEMAR